LEDANKVLSIWEKSKDKAGLISVSELSAVMEGKSFHRMGQPDKLDHLRRRHSIDLDSGLQRHLESINNARNCLVHRQGVVTERDLNGGSHMVVEWRKFRALMQSGSNESELKLGEPVGADATLVLRVVDDRKEFGLGETVRFDEQEFADVVSGIYSFAMDLVRKVWLASPDGSGVQR